MGEILAFNSVIGAIYHFLFIFFELGVSLGYPRGTPVVPPGYLPATPREPHGTPRGIQVVPLWYPLLRPGYPWVPPAYPRGEASKLDGWGPLVNLKLVINS